MLNALLDILDRHRHGIFGTVIVHAVFFLAFSVWTITSLPLKPTHPERTARIELSLDDPPHEEPEPLSAEEQAALEAAGPVTNVTSNITARAGQHTHFSEQRLADRVEQDLAAFEQQEFDRLAQERRERGEEIVMPELDPSKWDKELYKDKAAEPVRVEGATTVWHTLEGRHRESDVPGYRCLLGGRVAVDVMVARDGRVLRASVDPARSALMDECMREHALVSAQRARFSPNPTAAEPQTGTVFFLFVGQ
jgi:hypothetical protein